MQKLIKITSLALLITMIIPMSIFAADNVEVYYNGVKQDFTVTVTEIDNTVMVPVRAVFELFGFKVTWDARRQYIKSNTVLGRVQMAIGSTYVSLNDYQAYILDTYPRLYNGVSLIPVEFAQSCTDSSIQYQRDSNSLVIASK